jgi:hypothetical protein
MKRKSTKNPRTNTEISLGWLYSYMNNPEKEFDEEFEAYKKANPEKVSRIIARLTKKS